MPEVIELDPLTVERLAGEAEALSRLGLVVEAFGPGAILVREVPALLAGAGVKQGHIHGRSDKIGAYPASDACKPEDLSATLFHLMGINPATEIRDPLDRPQPLSPGKVIDGVLA